MNILPPLGIGDLLILKMHLLSNNLEIDNFNINKSIINEYRLEPNKYIIFIEYLLNKLFPNSNKIYVNAGIDKIDRINYKLNLTYIKNHYIFDNDFKNEYENYIIFHTKARFDECSSNFKLIEHKLINFCKIFKTNYNIIILGEKYVEQNKEAIKHNIVSLYNILMLMKNNNNIIDLTYDMLYSGNNIIDFEKDLFLINNAQLNVGFGYGGPLNICQAFSKNNAFYIDKLKHQVLNDYKKINNNVYDDINLFFANLNLYI
jgi:hypothetical protein